MVCVVESNKEIKKRKLRLYRVWIFISSALFWERSLGTNSSPHSWIFSSISSRSHLFTCTTLWIPTTPYTKVWSAHSPPTPLPPLMTCHFYTKTATQNPLCRLMFTLCHCLVRNLLRIRFAFKICLRHQSVTPILDPSLAVTDISSRNGCSYYW